MRYNSATDERVSQYLRFEMTYERRGNYTCLLRNFMDKEYIIGDYIAKGSDLIISEDDGEFLKQTTSHTLK